MFGREGNWEILLNWNSILWEMEMTQLKETVFFSNENGKNDV